MKKETKKLNHVVCECGYHNKPMYISIFGTCLCCKKVLDEKAKFKYDMNKKMRLWRGKKW